MIMQSLLKSYRAQFLDGWMSFKQSFNLGFKYTLILSVFVTLFSVIYFNFVIDYDVVMSEQLDNVIADLKKQNMNDEQIAKTIEISKKFMTLNSIIIIGFFSNVIIQTIINLILSAILKKEIKHD
jgi:fructose-specific phosphotransferase system IIC component